MKEKLKLSGKCFLLLLLADFLCFFLFMSFSVIGVAVGTKDIGYTAYTYSEDGEAEELYTYYYDDGEDTKKEEYVKNGVDITTRKIRSTVSAGVTNATKIATEICTIIILFAMIYTAVWTCGDKDNNKITFGRMKEEKYKGLKIGLLAISPMALLYLVLLADKFIGFFPEFTAIYKIMNYYLFTLVDIAYGGAKGAADISLAGMAILLVTLIIVPAITTFAYYCGRHEISISDRLIYKNKEKK